MFSKAGTALLTFALAVGQAVAAGNQALQANPTVANADLTVRGSDFLWAVFAIMLASALGVTVWAFMVPAGHRAFHWIGIALLFTASIAYFSMAADLGATPVNVEFVRYSSQLFTDTSINPYTRSIWYVRYIDWTITTPLLLLELLLSTGMPLSGIFATIFFDLVMIIAGLVGALVPSSYKWGYFTGSCIALFYITFVLIAPARTNAKALGNENYKVYLRSAGILAILWLLYPVCWGLADGGNVISTDAEMVFYGVLDILAKPVFLFIHLFGLRKIPYETFQLQSGHYSAYASVPQQNNGSSLGNGVAGAGHGHLNREKPAPGAHSVPAGNAAIQSNGGVIAHGAPGTHTQPGQMHPVGRTSDVTAV